jgi:hypothetical protein
MRTKAQQRFERTLGEKPEKGGRRERVLKEEEDVEE